MNTNNNDLLTKAYNNGLMDVIKEWLKDTKYASVSTLQRTFSISFPLASSIFNELISLDLVSSEPIYNKGHIVKVYSNLNNLKIYLLDINPKIISELKKAFSSYKEVEVVLDDFKHFMDTHKDAECIVSPANSFGIMNGGYDLAITNYFGEALQKRVQNFINKNYFGEQPVGTSILVDIPNTDKKLIHTPTMRTPSIIKDPLVIYNSMRSTLIVALKANIHSIVIPAFGGLTGGVEPSTLAKYMLEGYKQVREFKERE